VVGADTERVRLMPPLSPSVDSLGIHEVVGQVKAELVYLLWPIDRRSKGRQDAGNPLEGAAQETAEAGPLDGHA